MGYATYEKPYAIKDAGGNTVYEHAAFVKDWLEVTNSDTATIPRGCGVICDAASGGSVFPRWDYSVAGTDTIPVCVLKGKRVAAVASVNFYGVAGEAIPVGAQGRVLGPGTICAATCVASLTSSTLGGVVVGSATVGSVDSTASLATSGRCLGNLLQANGTSAGQSGSTTQLIVLIAPR